jgi:5-carboxymethyl-2-hydroxymuconate isomerase
MPHLFIDYSDNLPLDEAALMVQLNTAVCAHPTVAVEHDLKTRTTRQSSYRIGRHPEQRAYVHAELRLLAGRSDAVKKALSDAIAAVLRECTPHPPGMLVQLSVEIADMDRGSYYKGEL